MTCQFIACINLVGALYENANIVHPQLIGDVWNLYSLQGLWFEQEMENLLSQKLNRENADVQRWELNSFDSNSTISLRWTCPETKIDIAATQFFARGTELLTFDVKMNSSFSYNFIFRYDEKEGWGGHIWEKHNNILTEIRGAEALDNAAQLMLVWNRLPETLKNSLDKKQTDLLESLAA
jgi:hypothetical protein